MRKMPFGSRRCTTSRTLDNCSGMAAWHTDIQGPSVSDWEGKRCTSRHGPRGVKCRQFCAAFHVKAYLDIVDEPFGVVGLRPMGLGQAVIHLAADPVQTLQEGRGIRGPRRFTPTNVHILL